jgi:hypothetical protein|eukprot:COSAG01_NODE_2538_length_7480_cov_167.793930_5_plen_513_part_00
MYFIHPRIEPSSHQPAIRKIPTPSQQPAQRSTAQHNRSTAAPQQTKRPRQHHHIVIFFQHTMYSSDATELPSTLALKVTDHPHLTEEEHVCTPPRPRKRSIVLAADVILPRLRARSLSDTLDTPTVRAFLEGIEDEQCQGESSLSSLPARECVDTPRPPMQEVSGRPRKRSKVIECGFASGSTHQLSPVADMVTDTADEPDHISGSSRGCVRRRPTMAVSFAEGTQTEPAGRRLRKPTGIFDESASHRTLPSRPATSAAVPAAFSDVASSSIDDQAAAFLKAFVYDFQDGRLGGFQAVLQIKEQFRGYLSAPDEPDCEVDAAHRFLESRGETETVAGLRDVMSSLDLDSNRRMALIEYLLFRFQKSISDFLQPPHTVPPHLTAALDEAIAQHRRHYEERRQRDALYSGLEAQIESGGRVAAMRARAELAAHRARGWTQEWNARALNGGAVARRCEKAVQSADREALSRQAVEAEKARLKREEEQQEKAAAEERSRRRAALKQRAALWEQQQD